MERMLREKDREIAWLRDQNAQLLDRLMYQAGQTWTPPPVDVMSANGASDDSEDWVADPGQLP